MGGITTGSGRAIFLFYSNKIPQASNVLKEALKSCFKRKPIQRVFRSFLSSKINVKNLFLDNFIATLSQDAFQLDRSAVFGCIRDLWK